MSGTNSNYGSLPGQIQFKYVSTLPGSPNRDTAGVTIHTSGRSDSNTEGGSLLDGLAKKAGLALEKYLVKLGVDEDRKLVSVTPVPFDTELSVPARRRRGIVRFHLGGVFAEYPKLRLSTKSQCLVGSGVDAAGKDCMVISLNSAQPKRTVKRSSSSQQDGEKDKTATQEKAATQEKTTNSAVPTTAAASAPAAEK